MGDYIAKDSIPWGGVTAFTRGQRVLAADVEAHGLHDYVVGENTKEAREIKAEVSGRDVSDFETTTAAKSTAVKSTSESKG